jgi:hypothetical protein
MREELHDPRGEELCEQIDQRDGVDRRGGGREP